MNAPITNPIDLDSWLKNWMPWIRQQLDLPNDDEVVIQNWLDKGINNSSKIKVNELIKFNMALCFAPGPNLAKHIKEFNIGKISRVSKISVDGATREIINNDITPDYIITDLDGIDAPFINNNISKKCRVLVLAHGDNINKFDKFINQINSYENIIWCTQGKPLNNWVNTLGFTDGDRGLAFCVQNKVKVLPLGFSLDSSIVGRASKPYYSENQPISKRKMMKLTIARKIIIWLNQTNLIYTLDERYNPGITIKLADFMI